MKSTDAAATLMSIVFIAFAWTAGATVSFYRKRFKKLVRSVEDAVEKLQPTSLDEQGEIE